LKSREDIQMKHEFRNAMMITFIIIIGGGFIHYVSQNTMAVLSFGLFILFLWFHYSWRLSTKSMKKDYDDLVNMAKEVKGRYD